MICEHRKIGWLDRFLLAESGTRKCPNCGATVSYDAAALAIANVVLLIALSVCVAYSASRHTVWPFLVLFAFYILNRGILHAVAPIRSAKVMKSVHVAAAIVIFTGAMILIMWIFN